MDDRLRMHHDVDLFLTASGQTGCLASISSRPLFIMVAAVDRDLGAHLPVRVRHGLGFGVASAPWRRGRAVPERPAGRGQDDLRSMPSTLRSKSNTWKMALCSLNRPAAAWRRIAGDGILHHQIGRHRPALPCWRAPAMAPRRIAARVDARPAASDDRGHDPVRLGRDCRLNQGAEGLRPTASILTCRPARPSAA